MKDYEPRFWAKVDKTDGCWLWTAATTHDGYAQFKLDGRKQYVHRVAYELLVGPIPAGHQVDHVYARGCTNRHCVNPAHLEAVTPAENMRRGSWARKTHCPHGHEYTGANTRLYRGMRYCRTCHRNRERARYHRLKEAA